MIIKRITLNNFRQFKGEQVIDFSTDPEKNVTILLGVNTSGKTTLVQAFNWCLYEKTNFKTKNVLNMEQQDSLTSVGTKDVSVEIVLVHENKEYRIKRTQKYQRTAGDNVKGMPATLEISYKEENGETQPIRDYECKGVIESILPEALSGYFFLNGEMLEDMNNKSDVVAAVRGLMGLDIINSGMDHLDPRRANSVITKFTKELDTDNDVEANKKKLNIEEYKRQLENFEQRKSAVENELEYLKRRKEELNRTLLANKDVEIAQKEKNNLEKDIIYLKNQIENLEDRLKRDFSGGAFNYFAIPLINRAIDVINSAKQDGEGIPEMNAKSIDYILARKRCICGCDLTLNQGAVNCINHEKSLLPPQHVGTMLRTYKKDCLSTINSADRYADIVSSDYVSWADNNNEIEKKEKQFKEISSKIKGDVNVEKLNYDYADVRQQVEQKEELLIGIRENIASKKALIENTEKELNGLIATSNKNDKILKYIEYTKEIYNWFKESYDKQESEIKEKLLKKVNELFQQIYHGSDRKVEMNENYKINLQVIMDDKVVGLDTSPGLEGVKNFSFITGLIALAREKAQKVDEESQMPTSVEPYPLVMDAPFSNEDEKHIANISSIVPKIAEQVILIVMNKDWEFASKNMADRVGASYVIEKVDNKSTFSTIRRS